MKYDISVACASAQEQALCVLTMKAKKKHRSKPSFVSAQRKAKQARMAHAYIHLNKGMFFLLSFVLQFTKLPYACRRAPHLQGFQQCCHLLVVGFLRISARSPPVQKCCGTSGGVVPWPPLKASSPHFKTFSTYVGKDALIQEHRRAHTSIISRSLLLPEGFIRYYRAKVSRGEHTATRLHLCDPLPLPLVPFTHTLSTLYPYPKYPLPLA